MRVTAAISTQMVGARHDRVETLAEFVEKYEPFLSNADLLRRARQQHAKL